MRRRERENMSGRGIKPIERIRDVLDGNPPLIIIECPCGANTVARRPDAPTLLGWRVAWPEKTYKLMRVAGVCPKCVSTPEEAGA